MKIAMLAGEPSGDLLGGGLIAALREHFPAARFEGIGGERMISQGLRSLYPMEKLSVMGLTEVLRHLPELLRLRWSIYRYFLANPPHVFIGIDAPDFNLSLERQLRSKEIRTVHYVSPTVWAWRQRRIHKIARSVNLMLALFPFEADFYRQHRIPVHYVGHPLADEIPLENDRMQARQTLGIACSPSWVALLPGSRMNEVHYLGSLFVETALWLSRQRSDLKFLVPAATPRIYRHMIELVTRYGTELPIYVYQGRSRDVMAAADAVLLASGTATLEAMLLKRPMVVAYKVSPITAWIASRLIRVSHFSLPNLLAGRELVPEFMQRSARVETLGPAILNLLKYPASRTTMTAAFTELHHQLRCDADQQAAAAVAELIKTG